MSQLHINIGPPRTATTTLQKCFFPTIKDHLVLQKNAYDYFYLATKRHGHFKLDGRKKSFDYDKLDKRLDGLLSLSQEVSGDLVHLSTDVCDELHANIRFLAQKYEVGMSDTVEKMTSQLLDKALLLAQKICIASGAKGIIMAGEWFTGAIASSLYPDMSLRTGPVSTEVIADHWKTVSGSPPLISFCCRDPIGWIASRYSRYISNAASKHSEYRNAYLWTQRQIKFYHESAVNSAIFPAFHASFMKFNANLGFVRPYGFKELIESQDIGLLLGIVTQQAISFSEFPRENSLEKSNDIVHQSAEQIIQALRDENLLERLYREQLYQ